MPVFGGKASGTVTSVATGTGLTGGTITTTGTLSMANMAANTIKGNNTGGSAAPSDLTVAQTAAMFTVPTIQRFTSGSGTYTTPANCRWIRVTMVGGGGGGGGGGSASVGDGTAGSASTFGTTLLSCNGGALGSAGGGNGGAGGSASLGTGPIGTALTGGTGQAAIQCVSSGINATGGQGGATGFGGAGGGATSGNGTAGSANTGSGGGGGGSGTNANAISGAGGGSGGFVRAIITGPSATYSYAVGSGGSSGAAGTGGTAGGAGSAGCIEVEEHYI